MNEGADDRYEPLFYAFGDYLKSLKVLVELMGGLGVATTNVDPYANFAEVLVAREFDGAIQRATNAGFDVLTKEGVKIQVKSLRINSQKPLDNGRGWYEGTRTTSKASGPLLDAHKYAIVVYVDHSPYCMLVFPVVLRDTFPVVNVKDLNFNHVNRLLDGKRGELDDEVRVIDLRPLRFERIRAPGQPKFTDADFEPRERESPSRGPERRP